MNNLITLKQLTTKKTLKNEFVCYGKVCREPHLPNVDNSRKPLWDKIMEARYTCSMLLSKGFRGKNNNLNQPYLFYNHIINNSYYFLADFYNNIKSIINNEEMLNRFISKEKEYIEFVPYYIKSIYIEKFVFNESLINLIESKYLDKIELKELKQLKEYCQYSNGLSMDEFVSKWIKELKYEEVVE